MQSSGNYYLRFKLGKGTQSNSKMVYIFFCCPAHVPFRYVGWNRYCRPTHLTDHAIPFFLRKVLRNQIYLF